MEPIHIREVHILNVHSIMDKLMVLMKPFMKKELYDMVCNIILKMRTMFFKKCILCDHRRKLGKIGEIFLQIIGECRWRSIFKEISEKLRFYLAFGKFWEILRKCWDELKEVSKKCTIKKSIKIICWNFGEHLKRNLRNILEKSWKFLQNFR